jgi:hypothetical protein
MRSKRPHVNLTTKLASALLNMKRLDENGVWVSVIPHDEAKTLTADEIIARFDFHHGFAWSLGGGNHPSNLTPLPREDHRDRTAKIDVPTIAKVKRLSREQEEFRSRVLARAPGEPRARSGRWPKRSFPTARKDSA